MQKRAFLMSKKLTSALVFFFKMLAAIPYADASDRYPNFPTENVSFGLGRKTRYSFDADCLQPVTSSVGALGGNFISERSPRYCL